VEEFLHASAIAFERSSSAGTYLLATENKDIAGYFIISIGFADTSKSEGLSEEEKNTLKMSKCPDHLVPMYQSERFGFRLFNTPNKKRTYNQLFRII
jgi:hypothetical protein